MRDQLDVLRERVTTTSQGDNTQDLADIRARVTLLETGMQASALHRYLQYAERAPIDPIAQSPCQLVCNITIGEHYFRRSTLVW